MWRGTDYLTPPLTLLALDAGCSKDCASGTRLALPCIQLVFSMFLPTTSTWSHLSQTLLVPQVLLCLTTITLELEVWFAA